MVTTWLIASTFKPYLAILARSYSIFIWGSPSTFSSMMSAAPSTPWMAASISSAVCSNTSKSSPTTLMAKSARTPVINSLKRISMGCVNSKSNPGIAVNAFLNSSANSSLVSTVVHSLGGCSVTITSLSSMDMGSVGISAAPIRVTTCFTSGNFIRIFSISEIVSTVLLKVVPVLNTG